MSCDGEMPRRAFGHLLDADGCHEEDEDTLTVDVTAAASGNTLCTVTLTEREPVQNLKARIAESLNVPVSDQTLLLPNGQRVNAKRRLRSVLRSAGRSASVALVVS